jgi:hypothetical protein
MAWAPCLLSPPPLPAIPTHRMLAFNPKMTLHFPADGYESDEPTPSQRLRWAAAEADMRAKQSEYAAQGRDQTGVLMTHATNCRGLCCQAEETRQCALLFGAAAAEDHRRFLSGESWWQIFGDELYEMEQRQAVIYAATATERAARAALSDEAYRMKTAAEIVAIQARRGLKRDEAVKKNPTPCSRLYSCVGDKSSGGAKPTTRHVSSECWSHERTDPLTGKIIAKHVCPWLHPGEAGWQTQWNTDRTWRPAAAPTRTWEPENRFAAMGGGRPAAGGGGRAAGGGRR